MRYNTLDLLRFLAAFGVVMYHYTFRNMEKLVGDASVFDIIGILSRHGYLGVNLFFMISGFVILASSLNRTWYEFSISRFLRLYPTYWLCVTITALIIIFFPDSPSNITGREYLANLTMLNDYINISNIDDVYWTLQVELKFYGCIFILIALGWIKHYKIWLSVWLAATVTYLFFNQPFFMGWFINPYFSSFFIAGTAFYIAAKQGYSKYLNFVIVISFFVSMYYASTQSAGFIKNSVPMDSIVAMASISVFYLLFYAISTNKINVGYTVLISYLGGTTYPLYLLHDRAGKAVFDYYTPHINPYLMLLLTILAVLLLSLAIHVLLEKKIVTPSKRVFTDFAARILAKTNIPLVGNRS